MLSLKEHPLVTHHPDTLQAVRKAYDLDQPGRIDDMIDQLQEWINAQAHFSKKDFRRNYLEAFLICNKGSLEKTKENLEKLCSIKTSDTKLFITSIRANNMGTLFDEAASAPLPKLTKDHYRINILRNNITKYDSNMMYYYCIYSAFMLECMLKYNYSMGMILIFDYRQTQVFKTMLRIIETSPHFISLLNGYQIRIQSAHVICTSSLINNLVSFMKTIVNPKLLGRIYVHEDLESLYQHIDKDLMPADYGGKERTLKELSDDWKDLISTDEIVNYVDEMFRATIDKTKKPKK